MRHLIADIKARFGGPLAGLATVILCLVAFIVGLQVIMVAVRIMLG